MTTLKFCVKQQSDALPVPMQAFVKENEASWGLDPSINLSAGPASGDDKKIDYTSLVLLIYDGTLDPKDLRFLNQNIRFSTSDETQMLWVNTTILKDPIISQKFEFSGIKCNQIGKIASFTCFDGRHKPIATPPIDPTIPVEIVSPVPNTEHLLIVFKIPQGDEFNFSILIRDKMDRSSTTTYHPCDPQVGNDPPTKPQVKRVP